MEQTFKYKIRNMDNQSAFDKAEYNYTGLFHKLYNNLELSEDKGFINECLSKFNLDKTMYDYCLVDVKMSNSGKDEINKEKQKKIDTINKELVKFKKLKNPLSKKQKYYKKKLLKNKAFLLDTIKRDICFGGKDILRKITTIQQKEKKTKKDIKRLTKFKKEFTENRKRNIFLWGKAIEGGNRKVDFYLENNYVVFKLNKDTKIKINLIPFENKKRKKITEEINKLILRDSISLTVRISKTHLYLTFDNEIVNGFGFDITGCNTEIKNNPERDKKEIKKEFYAEQLKRKLKNKVINRASGTDLNPHEIGFSIVDVNEESGEIDKIIKYLSFDLSYYTKQENLSHYEREKLKYELTKVYDYMFNMCIHYKVSHFGVEDLKKITEKYLPNNSTTTFNRITKNIWNRELQVNLIKNRCDEFGIICNEVEPMYSSFIGNIKYDFNDCAAASVEVARRGCLKYKKMMGTVNN